MTESVYVERSLSSVRICEVNKLYGFCYRRTEEFLNYWLCVIVKNCVQVKDLSYV